MAGALLPFLLLATEPVASPPPFAPVGTPAQAHGFAIADTGYSVTVPGAYCKPKVIPAAASEDEKNAAGYTLAKPLYLQLCDRNGESLGDQDFLYVTYFRDYRPGVKSRAEFLEKAAPKIGNAAFLTWLGSDEFQDRVESRTEIDTGIATHLSVKPTALGHDETCIYTGTRASVTDSRDGEVQTLLSVSCVTWIDDHLVNLALASRSERNPSFANLARTLKNIAKSIERK